MKKYYGNKKMNKYYKNQRMKTAEGDYGNERLEIEESYYGIATVTGCGVYTSYSDLCETMKYVYGAIFRKFTEKQEAVDFAVNTYIALQLRAFGHVHETDPIRKMNWFYRPNPQMTKPFIIIGSEYPYQTVSFTVKQPPEYSSTDTQQ